MANELDELNGPVNEAGRDINVINKQLPVTVGFQAKLFIFFLWFPFIIPGIIWIFQKIKAENYLKRIQQKIQHNASQVDNFIEQRVVILENAVSIVNKFIDLDKEVMMNVAKLRSGVEEKKKHKDHQLIKTLIECLGIFEFKWNNIQSLNHTQL
ncbi:hypothetical protein [Mycoplasma buteonis]|uniref:hypothetical protein n=1 Tax=Mycoplasma buteonis TaxID=171280 RepID=UPI000A9F8493